LNQFEADGSSVYDGNEERNSYGVHEKEFFPILDVDGTNCVIIVDKEGHIFVFM